MLTGNSVSQADAAAKGIHLFWMAPFSWVYAPGGWSVQRREFSRKKKYNCQLVAGTLITRLQADAELRLPFGWLSYRKAQFDAGTPAEVFRLDLDVPATAIRLNITAKLGFSFALYRGKIVSAITPKNSGSFNVNFAAAAIDAVVTYLLSPDSIQYCVLVPEDESTDTWKDIPFLVKNLQLPLAELDPSLHSPAEELARAKQRLLPGETINPDEFKQLADLLRASIKTTGSPRHIDKVLLLREEENAEFEELNATAPLLSFISHPKWRRVMGFGWFDKDPALQPGMLYEYRITGQLPLEDVYDKVYGFHTIPSETLLPAGFLLGDLMLRFSQPPHIERAPVTVISKKLQLTRRGIRLQIPTESFWTFPLLEHWSVVIDFPQPFTSLQLELQPGHSLQYETWSPANTPVTGLQALPQGAVVPLVFPSPVSQLRLKGKGLLFTIRITQALRGIKPLTLVLPPVLFADTPLPAAPAAFSVKNLQDISSSSLQPDAIATKPTRAALGFRLDWKASLQNGLTFWPADEPTAPPLESTIYQVEHRQLPAADWKPLLPEENWILGNRNNNDPPIVLSQGTNLMQVFPESPIAAGNTGLQMHWDDVFDITPGTGVLQRPLPPLGTTHQYRIRAVDIIGRPSAAFTDSNTIELRKLLPPPAPVGPVQVVNDEQDFTTPNGVHARLLVQDAPDLTPAEKSLLGTDSNVILLKWGWHKEQRELDPYAKECRIYVRSTPLDAVEGSLVAVTALGTGRFECQFQLNDLLPPAVLRDSFVQLGDYPFYVESHETGMAIKMIVQRRIPDAGGLLSAPAPGPVRFGLLVGAAKMQPNAWTRRVAAIPITSATAYSFELRNVLTLTADHSKDAVWVGVSSADDQPYIPDKLLPAENRSGNESPIVPVFLRGNFCGKPVFSIPPPLEAVPRINTKEPAGVPLQLLLDCAAFLPAGTLNGITHIRLERVHAGIVFSRYRVSSDSRIMAIAPSPAQPDLEVVVANPADKTAITTALRQNDVSRLADQYLVFLAGSHPYRAAFFEAVTPNPVALAVITDSFLPQTNRYVYRIRTGNAAGLMSAGDAMLKLVVRIPSVKPGPVPDKANLPDTAPGGSLLLQIAADDSITHAILFYYPYPATVAGPAKKGELLRIANRPDLYPNRLLRFRTATGVFATQLVKDLTDADVEKDEAGNYRVLFTIADDSHSAWQVTACTLTRDGAVSAAAGPWRINAAVTA
jgi:hypothetical protein